MPKVDTLLIKTRAAALRATGEAASINHLNSLIGQHTDILMETPNLGRHATYAAVKTADKLTVGDIVPVTILARDGLSLIAAPRT